MTADSTSLTDKNLYAYCDNNPVNRIDDGGDMWRSAIALSGGSALLAACVATVKTVWTAAVTVLGSITPVGWAIIGAVAVTAVVAYVAPKVVKRINITAHSSKSAVSM